MRRDNQDMKRNTIISKDWCPANVFVLFDPFLKITLFLKFEFSINLLIHTYNKAA